MELGTQICINTKEYKRYVAKLIDVVNVTLDNETGYYTVTENGEKALIFEDEYKMKSLLILADNCGDKEILLDLL